MSWLCLSAWTLLGADSVHTEERGSGRVDLGYCSFLQVAVRAENLFLSARSDIEPDGEI